MNLVHSAFLAVSLVVSSWSVATAQDFERGLAAYEAGDFDSALETWRPMVEGTIGFFGSNLADHVARSLSDMPDSNTSYARMRAANHIGIMHQFDQGVLQDDVEAVRWFRIAAEGDHTSAQYNLC